MKNKSVLKITNSTPRRIHLKRGTHKSHPLGFPLYSGFSSYIYIYIYTHMCRYIGVDRGRYTNSLVPPSRYRFTIVRATLPNFGVTMGLCLAEAGSPGSSLEIRPNRLRHETKEKARKRGPRNETGGRERERKSLSTKEEGFRYGLPRCLHWHAINGLRNSHEARYGPTKGRNSIRGPTFR